VNHDIEDKFEDEEQYYYALQQRWRSL
jgi:hypothetical protein